MQIEAQGRVRPPNYLVPSESWRAGAALRLYRGSRLPIAAPCT